jgi:kumamolisin
MAPMAKTLFLVAAVFFALVAGPRSLAAPELRVIIPDSSGRITKGEPGRYAHTQLQILETPAGTSPSTSVQINSPATMRAAYDLPSVGGTGAIALVDAYDYPTALTDFNTFAAEYGLPQETSTTVTANTNEVFQIVYALRRPPLSGGTYIAGWNMEEALDIEWAHAIAPGAKIYLVEAASSATSDLLYAVEVASRLPGVHQISMSWGTDETRSETSYDDIFAMPSITYFASGGDIGDEMEYPSASPNVVSVGGTTLTRDSTGVLLSETGWNNSGCGISLYERRPTFQSAISSEVGIFRGANDVSFDANPATGVNIYDSTELYGVSGWQVVGGTSLSSPSWAGVVNLASAVNGIAAGLHAENIRLYVNLGDDTTFRDITSGDDGSVECEIGWDQPTGIGSPLGLVGK